ncbi:hypothetical protein Q5752_002940 [Cryptotrichosporon argae]
MAVCHLALRENYICLNVHDPTHARSRSFISTPALDHTLHLTSTMASTPQTNGHASTSVDVNATSPDSTASKVQPGDVGWQFVPQYYNFVNKQPHRLHCFYNKRSTFVHGDEGEEAQVALGQQEIHERIVALGFDDCKVYIHSIDSQSSAGGGIVIQVIGEMSNANGPWRKFAQTFFLAEQPNGYFVLNDIFRYLREEADETEADEEEAEAATATQPVVANPPADVHPVAAPVVPISEPESGAATPASVHAPAAAPEAAPAPVEPIPAVEPSSEPEATEPELVNAPAPLPTDAIPVEAVVASVPDKDIAPSEPAAVQVPTPAEPEAPKPAASPAPEVNAPAVPNGTPVVAPAPAAPAKPKSWASLAAGAAARAPATPAPAAPVAKKPETPAPAAAAAAPAASPAPAPPALTPRHPFYENALKVNTPHCFVKLPNWTSEGHVGSGETMDEATLRSIAQRFGDVNKVEIVKNKACAFIEFARVESARKAIIACLSPKEGGEGGVVTDAGRLNFETRKEKDERTPKGGRGGRPASEGRGGAQGSRGGARVGGVPREDGQERGGPVGRGRGRGRGGPPTAGSDRPAPAK